MLYNKSDPKLLRQESCKGAETDSRAKFDKEIIAEVDRRPKWVPHYGAQADSGPRSGSAQALLKLAQACSGSAQACSPSAQVKAAVAHVRRLKRNQRKGKLILSLSVSYRNLDCIQRKLAAKRSQIVSCKVFRHRRFRKYYPSHLTRHF